MDADGSNQTRLTNNTDYDREPAWSPDGTRIAFSSGRDGILEIYVMDADGSDQTRITNDPAIDMDPAWSPMPGRLSEESVAAPENLTLYPNGIGPWSFGDRYDEVVEGVSRILGPPEPDIPICPGGGDDCPGFWVSWRDDRFILSFDAVSRLLAGYEFWGVPGLASTPEGVTTGDTLSEVTSGYPTAEFVGFCDFGAWMVDPGEFEGANYVFNFDGDRISSITAGALFVDC